MIDRRLAWFVVALGGIVLTDGAVGMMKGAAEIAGAGGTLGLGLILCGLALVLRRRVMLAAMALCFLTATAMALRLHRTQRLVPALPLGVLAVVVGYALLAERRRVLRGGGARRARDR